MEDHARGFQRWLKTRAAKTSTDRDYEDFVNAMRGPDPGRNGVATSGTPGGEDPAEGIPDSVVYEQYLSVLSGKADRRRAEEMVKTEKLEREQEIIRSVSQVGGGMSRSFEHLRARIPGAGRPFEGS